MVDQVLPRVVQGLCRTLAVSMSIIVVIGSSFPPFFLTVLPLGWLYLKVMRFVVYIFLAHELLTSMTECRYYLATSRELKRLDVVTRSPIFAWFSESLAGLSTIRAFNQQSIFIASNRKSEALSFFFQLIIVLFIGDKLRLRVDHQIFLPPNFFL